MKIISVEELKGGEYLSKAVLLNDQVLLYEGTCVRNPEIDILVKNEIQEVEIFDEEVRESKTMELIKEELHTDCQEKVKSILNNYVCKDNESLKEIAETAENIIDEIFTKEEIAEKVYDIKERSANLYDHSITVSALSVLTAVKLNMDQNSVYSIGVGSLLHDLGLKYISVDYKNIETTSLTPDNLFEYRKHTVYGFSSVEKESWMSSTAKKIILFHHENLNGTGYPLKQRNIPMEVKIVSVCDAFDDLICGIGHEQIRVQEAIEYIKRYKDVYFDGKVVDIFLMFVAAYPVDSKVRLNTGEIARVVEQNDHYTDRPYIVITHDKNGVKYKIEKKVNLAENRKINIEEVL